MRTVGSWFSFENRCLLCGQKFGDVATALHWHLKAHITEGYLSDELEQLKPHPIGFPGPPLGSVPPAKPPAPKDFNGPKRADYATFDDWCAARVKWADESIQCSTPPSPA